MISVPVAMEENFAEETRDSNNTIESSQPNEFYSQSYGQQLKALTRTIARIRESLDLETIFKTTVTEVRQLLKADRVGVFRFEPGSDWKGEFIFEDVEPQWKSALKEKVQDHCFGDRFAPLYTQGRLNVVSDIYQAEFKHCYIEILEKFQVRANVVVPLLNADQLWGLLCIHQCSGPRKWQTSEIEFISQISEHLGVALQHTELLAQARFQAEQQVALTGVITRIRESLDLQTIFKNTANEVRQLLKADRVGVLRFYPELDWEGEFIAEDVAPGWSEVISAKVRDRCFAEKFRKHYQNGRISVIPDIHLLSVNDRLEILEKFEVRANLVTPLLKGKELWGLLCVHQCSSARHWSGSEIEFVQQIAAQLGVALQQADYLQQVQRSAAQLAQAAEREKAALREKAIATTIEKIRQSLDVQTIFLTATEEARQQLKADRVVIYRFNPDWSGEFIFESVSKGWTSLLEKQWEQPNLRDNISECSVKFLTKGTVTDTYLQGTEGGKFTLGEIFRTCNDIYSAGFSNCYIQLLESYEARAYAIVAIYHGQKLWGLLAAFQNSSPREWADDEVYLLSHIGTQLGIALQQGEYLKRVETQAAQLEKAAERQRGLATTVEKIRRSLDIDDIFQTTTQEVRNLLQVERVAIYRFYNDWSGEFVADSIVDGWTPIVKTQPTLETTFLQAAKGGQYPRNETFVPILQGEKLWGLLVAYQNSQPRYWQEEEVNLLAQVGVQLGVALQQAETLKQIQTQAAQLEKAAKREKALSITIEKIRESLDIDTIFSTTTGEVRRLLEVDRVGIYRFSADGHGEFVAESVTDEWMPLVKNPFIIEEGFLLETKDGNLAHSQSIAVDDIYLQAFSPRSLIFLEQIQARAFVIVPIFQGNNLWGLLATYQNSRPREWQDHEINLLSQIATQLGVALKQAELLEQTRLQKEQLNQALKDLQQTQTQLIQGEKMAGLGQLVAGLAHEINNPINFIYGNLSYVNEYTQSLLSLLHLYQENNPSPSKDINELIKKLDLDFIAEDLPKMLNSMEIGADRIRLLVLSLHTFSRLDHAEIKPVDIHEGIDSTLLILQHRFKAKPNCPEIDLVKEYGDLPRIECYAAQLNQVFMNILTNAIDAIEMANWDCTLENKEDNAEYLTPRIRVSTELIDEKVVRICIGDNGCGMTEEVRSRIFDPFFTTKEPGKGTGLGLSISYQIVVEKHGGEIKCFSTPSKGTEFWIEISVTSPTTTLGG